ncbi:MAG: hypothetical protein QXX36_01080 [Candidatus Rehaiarchaeum fermentans]|nr:hypothetical protein [Candidatus Rehaiarchaeum fermentans]MCW1302207.1 hypothetical protein [Candidatus Rehaiarchaeum fermentans]
MNTEREEELVKGKISYQEFIDGLNKYPSWGYNAPQSLIESLVAFSKKYGNKNGKRVLKLKGEKWIDLEAILTAKEDDPRGVQKTLYGLDEYLAEIIKRLEVAAVENSHFMIMLLGPAGAGKNALLDTLAATYSWYTKTPEGIIYVPVLDMEKIKNDEKLDVFFKSKEDREKFVSQLTSVFGRLNYLKLTLGETPINSLYLWFKGTKEEEKFKKLVREKGLNINYEAESSTLEYISTQVRLAFESFGKEGLLEEFLKASISLLDGVKYNLVVLYSRPQIALSNKNLDISSIIGGDLDYGLLNELRGNKSPITYNYGIAGNIWSTPGVRRSIVLFNETYKAGDDFRNTLLDFIQDFKLYPTKLGKESLNVILFGTTNLYDLKEESLNPHTMSRLVKIYFRYMLNYHDVVPLFEEAFRNIEHSPRAAAAFAILYVGLAIEKPPADKNLTLLDKILIYGGDVSYGIRKEDLMMPDTVLPIEAKKEGKDGMPNRIISSQLAIDISEFLRKIGIKEDDLLDILFSGNGEYLKGFISSISDLSEVARGRIDQAVEAAIQYYRYSIKLDITNALYSDDEINDMVKTYVTQVWYLLEGKEYYTDSNNHLVKVDKDWLSKIENGAKLESNSFREAIHNALNYYASAQQARSIYDVIDDYVKELNKTDLGKKLRMSIIDLSMSKGNKLMPSDLNKVKQRLISMGYSPRSADLAIILYQASQKS